MNKLTCLTIIAGLLACMNDGFAQQRTFKVKTGNHWEEMMNKQKEESRIPEQNILTPKKIDISMWEPNKNNVDNMNIKPEQNKRTPGKINKSMWESNKNNVDNMNIKPKPIKRTRGNIAARWQNQINEKMNQAAQDNKPKETLQFNKINKSMWEEKIKEQKDQELSNEQYEAEKAARLAEYQDKQEIWKENQSEIQEDGIKGKINEWIKWNYIPEFFENYHQRSGSNFTLESNFKNHMMSAYNEYAQNYNRYMGYNSEYTDDKNGNSIQQVISPVTHEIMTPPEDITVEELLPELERITSFRLRH